jgi:hypothetical protein
VECFEGNIFKEKNEESVSSQIICLNLKEFEHVIMRDHLWNLPDKISGCKI